MPTRRAFLKLAAAATIVPAQALTTRPNLAVIDHDRILRIAATATTVDDLPALAAANLIDPNGPHRDKAIPILQGFLKQTPAIPTLTGYEELIHRVTFAELAQSIPYLKLESALDTQAKQFFAVYLSFLTENRTALLARDAKDHHASSWLLQTTAFARLTANEGVLVENRHRFHTPTLRNQINAEGLFPHELHDANPLRLSLFNLDLLAGTAQLLSTRFESVWDIELPDGPGMRSAIARHAAFIRDTHTWPYPADAAQFALLPGRRPALLFAARAYNQPDYAALWQTMNPDPTDPDILKTFPIREPILWRPGT